jgi:hypothetical protein
MLEAGSIYFETDGDAVILMATDGVGSLCRCKSLLRGEAAVSCEVRGLR